MIMSRSKRIGAVLAATLVLVPNAFAAPAPSNETLFELYQEQQATIESQNREIEKLNEQQEAAADAIEHQAASSQPGDGGSKWIQRTSLGGYGELHFNELNGKNGSSHTSTVDLHRFVLFVGHEFSDSIRLFSELEVEHAVSGEGKKGEVELEQAYIQFDLNQTYTASGGLFLVPVGLLNETHEPPTFYGVERNPIEKNIIPSTWWEAGGMLSGHYENGVNFDFAVTSALRTDGADLFKIRSGRQKVSKANAEDVALTGRLVWRGMPGLELGLTTVWQENIAATGQKTPATLVEMHVVYERGQFGLKALYGRWDLHSNAAESTGQDEQYGFYLEPSYKICEELGVFARYNQWNTSAGSVAGKSKKRQIDLGFNYWPHPQVVIKFDGQIQTHASGQGESNGINLGIGYQF